MLKLLAIGTLGLASMLVPFTSQAHVDVGVSIGVPFYGAPYYSAPAPVWRGPAVVYREYPRPYYYNGPGYYPGAYYARPYARPYDRGYRQGYRDGRRDDRRDDRRWRDDGYRHRH